MYICLYQTNSASPYRSTSSELHELKKGRQRWTFVVSVTKSCKVEVFMLIYVNLTNKKNQNLCEKHIVRKLRTLKTRNTWDPTF